MSLEKTLHKTGFVDTFVSRPIFGLVVNLLIIIAGLAAINSVDVREMPDVDSPVLTVRTDYEGAVPSTVDSEITQVLEDALSALDGLSYIESSSSSGSSRITIDLSDNVDIDTAANEAREIVSNQLRQLPDDIDDPTVSKSDTNADAIMRLALLGNISFNDLTQLAEGQIYNRLSQIDGVAEINIRGDRPNEFRVTLDMPSLLSRGLDVTDVSTALEALRDDTPLGEIDGNSQTLALSVGSEDVTVDTISQTPINNRTLVSDVALVQLVASDASVYTRVNGQAAVGLDVTRQSDGNTLDISRAVNLAVEELRSELPEGVQLIVGSDDGIFIEGSLNEVAKSILLATLIVVAVIFLFLRSLRATLIPAITIPVALIGTVAAIWLTGFSINTISLLALVLATGMVVDDAIVVIENIVRKRKAGMGAFAAAAAGTNEVFFAVISTTATLAAVFIPISFMPGQAGGVFSEFGFVLAFAVTLSSITALTLTPVLAAVLDPGKHETKSENETAQKPGFLARSFDAVMDWSIRTPLLVVAIAIAFAMIAISAALTLPSTVTPDEDRGFFLIQARGASDTALEYLDTQTAQIEEILEPYLQDGRIRAVQAIIGIGGGTSAFVVVRLPDWDERDFTQQELLSSINPQLSNISGVQVSARTPNSLNIRGAGSGLGFAVTGTVLSDMTDATSTLLAAMSQNSLFVNPQLSDNSVNAQLEINIDNAAAQDLGLTGAEVSAIISAMVQGDVPVSVFQGDDEIDVNVVPGGPPIDDPSDIASLSLHLGDGLFVPVSAVASLDTTVSDAQIERKGGNLSVSAQANLAAGVDLSVAMSALQEIAADSLPDGMGIVFTGEAATLADGESGIYAVFAIALS